MTLKTSRPKNIDEYIAFAPEQTRVKLCEIRACIRKAAPKAEEGIKWAMPAFSGKRILVMFAGFKKHIGMYPTTGPIKKFAKDLKKYKTAKGSIQFPLEKPLPLGLIRKITLFRLKESMEEDKKWRS
jgi:uncharacterized protein YdhG (YjbR/CyaY superfamily)